MSNVIEISSKARNNTTLENAIRSIELKRFNQAKSELDDLLEEGVLQAYQYLGYIHEVGLDSNPILDYEKAFFYIIPTRCRFV